MIVISVIVPAHNPRPEFLARVLRALGGQTIGQSRWELIVVDNASTPPISKPASISHALPCRFVTESRLGLTAARLRGIAEARGSIFVFVDDDNLPAPGFLAEVESIFSAHPNLGAAGGPVAPEFETTPPEWTREFWGLLALRDHGPVESIARGAPSAPWPEFAPVGAGLCVRRAAVESYVRALAADPGRLRLDRAGRSLASGGDNDLVFTLLHAGWDVGYFPSLRLTHLIPASRLESAYLGRLNTGIQQTWVKVLALHGQCPWPAIPRWTVPLRSARAWLRTAAWRSSANRIRWRGLAGRFRGQADLE